LSKFFEALNRTLAEPEAPEPLAPPRTAAKLSSLRPVNPAFQFATPPTVRDESAVVSALSRMESIRRVTETLAPAARYSGDLRVVVAGCGSGDGASSVAGAIAVDLSQRLGVRTLLVDGNLRRARIVKIFGEPERALPELAAAGKVLVRETKWLQLDVASFSFPSDRIEQTRLFEELSQCMAKFPVSVIDVGAIRLDGSLLPLVRPDDPVLVVVRAGHTERKDLSTTASVFATLSKSIRGIILNAAAPATPSWIRRLLSHGKTT
jgi:Mrp family chromosome partitioning ATPase